MGGDREEGRRREGEEGWGSGEFPKRDAGEEGRNKRDVEGKERRVEGREEQEENQQDTQEKLSNFGRGMQKGREGGLRGRNKRKTSNKILRKKKPSKRLTNYPKTPPRYKVLSPPSPSPSSPPFFVPSTYCLPLLPSRLSHPPL
jgi:hypothetical protein